MMGNIEALAIQAVEKQMIPGEWEIPSGREISPNIESSEVKEGADKRLIEKPDVVFIERTPRLALIEQNNAVAGEKSENNGESVTESDSAEKKGLTDEEKGKIKEETGWSDEIIDCIQNMKQYEILKNADLKEMEINGRKCLIKENIDLDYTDADGITNRERIARGLAPLDSKNGKPIELHHLGQKKESPLIELTEEEHRTGEFEDGKKNQSLWHDNSKETEIHGDGNTWKEEREAYWKKRSNQLKGDNN